MLSPPRGKDHGQVYAVIGQRPNVDTSRAVGPYHSYEKALKISEIVDSCGYVTEIVELMSINDLEENED